MAPPRRRFRVCRPRSRSAGGALGRGSAGSGPCPKPRWVRRWRRSSDRESATRGSGCVLRGPGRRRSPRPGLPRPAPHPATARAACRNLRRRGSCGGAEKRASAAHSRFARPPESSQRLFSFRRGRSLPPRLRLTGYSSQVSVFPCQHINGAAGSFVRGGAECSFQPVAQGPALSRVARSAALAAPRRRGCAPAAFGTASWCAP